MVGRSCDGNGRTVLWPRSNHRVSTFQESSHQCWPGPLSKCLDMALYLTNDTQLLTLCSTPYNCRLHVLLIQTYTCRGYRKLVISMMIPSNGLTLLLRMLYARAATPFFFYITNNHHVKYGAMSGWMLHNSQEAHRWVDRRRWRQTVAVHYVQCHHAHLVCHRQRSIHVD